MARTRSKATGPWPRVTCLVHTRFCNPETIGVPVSYCFSPIIMALSLVFVLSMHYLTLLRRTYPEQFTVKAHPALFEGGGGGVSHK